MALGHVVPVVSVDLIGDLLQGIDAVLVYGVAAPCVHQTVVGNIVKDIIAVGGIVGNLLHGAVQEDAAGLNVLGIAVAQGVVHAGDEDVIVNLIHQVDADGVAVLVQVDVILLVL